MSYKALYRTYRPSTFNDVVGQNHIIQTLQNVVNQNKIAHAYLFAGPRGTGKTSVAQIFANEINRSASGIDKDYSLDIIEIDAASNNGIAEVRTIIENSKFSPSEGEYKVYIVDEVHMLTKGAWNALLKTLEEPPTHVVFILATTEPHKIPATILSRTQRFNFKRIDNHIIYEQLIKIFNQEAINYDQESIKFIAKLANGGLRDALSIAEQASAFGNGIISFEAISQVFGLVSISKQIEVLNLSFNNVSKKLIQTLNNFSDNGIDLERLTLSLIDILRDFIVYKKTSDLTLIIYLNIEDINDLKISLNFAYKAVDELIKLASEIKWAELPRHLFELTILKMATFNTNKDYEDDTNNHSTTFLDDKVINSNIFDEKQSGPETLRVKLDDKPSKTSLFNKELHDLKLFAHSKLESISDNDIFHTTLIDTNKSFDEDKKDHQKVDNLMTKTNSVINQLQNQEQDDKQISFEKNAQDSVDIIKLFGLDAKTSDEKIIKQNETVASKYNLQEIINLLLLANKEILIEAKDRWNILSAYINSNEYGEYAAVLASVKIITAGENFLLLSSEDNEMINTLNVINYQLPFLKLLENILGKAMHVFAITREQFEEVKKIWNIMKAEQTLPTPTPISPVKIEKKQSDTEEFGLEIFGELFNK